MPAVKAPVPKLPLSEVVAVPEPSVAPVPHAKPLVVALAPPVAVMFPLSVIDTVVTLLGALVVTVG